jgi:hypothetical protein
MGAPLGNQNAAKAKQWTAAIERAIERLADPAINPDALLPRSPKAKGLDMLADIFVAQRQREDPMTFFREFGDRLDGKPAQQLALTGEDGGPVQASLTVLFMDKEKP